MTDVDDVLTGRSKFLFELYDVLEGKLNRGVPPLNVAQRAGLEWEEARGAVTYLVRKGVIRYHGQSIGLTTDGIDMVESARSKRARTQSPSLNSITVYGDVHSSSFQQAGHGGKQGATIKTADLAEFVAKVREEISNLGLDEGATEDFEADLSTLETQLRKTQPNKTIVEEGIRSIQTVLEGAVATGLATKAPELITLLRSFVS